MATLGGDSSGGARASATTGGAAETDCDGCAAGKYSSSLGASDETACQDCVAGKYGAQEARVSIEDCVAAGIRVIVITGDNQKTAEAICRQIGLFDENENLSKLSFVGREFDALSERKQIQLLTDAKNMEKGMVFSRAEPAFKQNIVRLLKEQLNEIAANVKSHVNDVVYQAAGAVHTRLGNYLNQKGGSKSKKKK